MAEEKWEVLETYESLATAELVKGILESEGIGIMLRGSTVPYGDRVILGDGGITELLVKEVQLEKAREILKELKESGKIEENFKDKGGNNGESEE